MHTYINIYYKVTFSVFCSCFSSINYIHFSSCFSNLLQMIKTGISFMQNNNKVHVLAKYILCGLSRSCCTKKDVLIKSLFYFLIFYKIYQLKSRPSWLLLHTLTNQCPWVSIIQCLSIPHLEDILFWLIKTLLEYVWLNISWLWDKSWISVCRLYSKCFSLFVSLCIASGKIASFDSRTGGKIINLFKTLWFDSFKKATHLSFSDLETKLRQIHPALTEMWAWKLSSKLFPYSHSNWVGRKWKCIIRTEKLESFETSRYPIKSDAEYFQISF